jgi:hypothetical protein
VREFTDEAEAPVTSSDQIDALRRQLGEAMPRALADDNGEHRAAFAQQLEDIAAQAAEGEATDSPWLPLAALLRAAAALLRGEAYKHAGLLPEDVALLVAWGRGEVLEEADAGESISLAGAIGAWATGAEGDAARHAALLELLNYCADAAVHVLREGDAETREALARALVPLRAALLRWPHAAELPPYGAFLGCLQALLRADEAQLARLFARLDEGLAAALERIGDAVAAGRTENEEPEAESQSSAVSTPGDATAGGSAHQDANLQSFTAAQDMPAIDQSAISLPPEIAAAMARGDLQEVERELAALPEGERERALAALRRHSEQQVASMAPEEQRRLALWLRQEQIRRAADEAAALAAQALREGDPDARRRLAIEMGQLASHYAQGEERGSPYDELASFLRGVAAVLRGTPVPPVPPAFAERLAALESAAEER